MERWREHETAYSGRQVEVVFEPPVPAELKREYAYVHTFGIIMTTPESLQGRLVMWIGEEKETPILV